ncbi:MAG: hypothetical protein A3E87_06475 [Gammaproteobacteria bacterium RIFCSPHIGHO2_12_FULL_35_23]|nr:MAG: hypothetical protein A3E87_06475 [Gammaproteobacteria bacterium RIFCSPHIGHO2_12_FULL_35_23]
MVERIDFYILSTPETISFTCRLLEKAYKEKHRIYVQTNSKAEALKLNDSLWTFKDISFVPHRLQDMTAAPIAPITIGVEEGDPNLANVLVSALPKLPKNYQAYQRIALVIANDEAQKAEARDLYKKLKASEITLQVHNL